MSVTRPETPERPERTGGSNPKRHHVVAKFYLKRFAVAENVELVRRDDSQPPFLCGIERALAENYFYSVETDDGREPLGEEFLRDHVDGTGSEAIRRLFDEGRSLIAPGPREKLSFFLAFQYVRGYRVREAAVAQEKATAQVLSMMATPSEVKRIARLRGDEISDEQAADTAAFANSGKFKIEVARQANLHMAVSFPMVPELVKFFSGRHWRVLEYDEPTFITSDEPVALVGPDPAKLGSAGGLANAPEIVFPIDPRRALVMVRPDRPADEMWVPGTARQAEVINRHVAYGAHRFIVRMPGTNPLAGWTVPKKAPAVMVVPVDNGFLIGTTTNATEEQQARMAKRIQAKHGSGGPKRRP
jgi:hypothetical protein